MQQNAYACESLCFPFKRLALKLLLLTRGQASVQAYETALKHIRIKAFNYIRKPFWPQIVPGRDVAVKKS